MSQPEDPYLSGKVKCPNDMKVLGGGYRNTVFAPLLLSDVNTLRNYPLFEDNSWNVKLYDPLGAVHQIEVFAICATLHIHEEP